MKKIYCNTFSCRDVFDGYIVCCVSKADVILVLHPNNGEPNRVIHYTSETVLPHFTYGDKTFGGWYFDENFENRFQPKILKAALICTQNGTTTQARRKKLP